MFKKQFSTEQLSKFMQIAMLINILGLLSDIIVYYYLPSWTTLKCINENLSNLSLFMICLVIIPQSFFIFIKSHQKLINKYKIITLGITICIYTFICWLLMIDNAVEESFIIFYSNASRMHHNNKLLLIIIICIFILLIFNFYHTLKKPDKINDASALQTLHELITIVIKKYVLVFIFFLGILHFQNIPKFYNSILTYIESSILLDVKFVEIFIPVLWILIIIYYLYQKPKE